MKPRQLRHRFVLPEGYVLQIVHGSLADGPYYCGDGEWGSFEGAKAYYSRSAMRFGLSEAKKSHSDPSADVAAFGVYV